MDLTNPLFELKSRAMAEGLSTVELAADCALDAWSDAFNHVTHLRRENILQVTHSDYALAENPQYFSVEETDQLFGDQFVSKLTGTMKLLKEINEFNEPFPPMKRRRHHIRIAYHSAPTLAGRSCVVSAQEQRPDVQQVLEPWTVPSRVCNQNGNRPLWLLWQHFQSSPVA